MKNFDRQESCTHIGNVHGRWSDFGFTALISSFDPAFGRSRVISHSCMSSFRISLSRNDGARRFLARFLTALWLCSCRKLENIPFTRTIKGNSRRTLNLSYFWRPPPLTSQRLSVNKHDMSAVKYFFTKNTVLISCAVCLHVVFLVPTLPASWSSLVIAITCPASNKPPFAR